MDFIKSLTPSEKKQFIGLGIAIVVILGVLVLIYTKMSNNKPLDMKEVVTLSHEASKIDRIAMELSRLGPTYNTQGQEVSQYELQNPVEGSVGDDGTYDTAVEFMSASVDEVNRVNQSVDLSNGMPASAYLNKTAQTQPVAEPIPTSNLNDLEPSIIPVD